jgi:hypothetical protein
MEKCCLNFQPVKSAITAMPAMNPINLHMPGTPASNDRRRWALRRLRVLAGGSGRSGVSAQLLRPG